MTPGDVIRLRESDVIWRAVEDEVIVLDRRGWSYISINDSGGVLWPRLVQGATIAQLAATLVETFGIEPDRARADADAFVSALAEHDLIER
jgi:hypothetical protein